jgi:pyruvate-ferredoxin/flavodoxin oxidoreductase
MSHSQSEQAMAVECGHWKLFRYDPRLSQKGLDPYQADSSEPTKDYSVFTGNESRFS